MKYDLISTLSHANSEKDRSQTYDLPISNSEALPLSYRRLVGAYIRSLDRVHVTKRLVDG